MATYDIHTEVHEMLRKLDSIGRARELFSRLGYDPASDPLSRIDWAATAREALAEDPLVIATNGDGFKIIYSKLKSDKLYLGHERSVVSTLLRQHPYSLFLFSNPSRDHWHFVNVKAVSETETEEDRNSKKRPLFRRISVGENERLGDRLRTASERISILEVPEEGMKSFYLQQLHDKAFDVEKVTKDFYEEYKGIFRSLEENLRKQTKDRIWAHDYSLQFLNRIMFLYFVQRKRWLGDDPEFLKTFWYTYSESSKGKDLFFEKWLQVLFFEAFNKKFHGGHRYFPDGISKALHKAPFLNGGLFEKNELDRKHDFTVQDRDFERIFRFFEKYNFTIAEDSPLDQEVAVDPEMIGKVYESLVNVEETTRDQRSGAGIFYTPRTEIDLMCRLALVDNLANYLGQERRKLLYEAVFAFEQEDKDAADRQIEEENVWPELDSLLRGLTVLDPAVGSGSFLVGMLRVLDDLSFRCNNALGAEEDPYNRKKRIIGQTLYGIDVMPWAVDVAELRLWLQLVIDTEIHPSQLQFRPLLPNLSFKVRCGDSLVQQLGGISLSRMKEPGVIDRSLKGKLTKLAGEKLKFYFDRGRCKYRGESEIRLEELRIFKEIVDDRRKNIQKEIKPLRLDLKRNEDKDLLGDDPTKAGAVNRQISLLREQIRSLTEQLKILEETLRALLTPKDVPLVWDIAFVEIFQGDKQGFDIVIGNPPYVRQERIANPQSEKKEPTRSDKDAYKARLIESVYAAYPNYFKASRKAEKIDRPLDKKNDLYVYFYFKSMSLLNEKGSFCFITSNSWLDVGYGKNLQEFLLRRGHVRLVIDNKVKRSFAASDVNTIITVFSKPDEKGDSGLNRTARFVMFNVPFEQVLSPIVFEEIEEAKERRSTPEYKVFPKKQQELLEEGLESEDNAKLKDRQTIHIKTAKYTGNKWGGKYLRAPDIYWTILEKGKDKLVRLGDIAEVRRGFTTGCNEFFYLDENKIKEWGIERRFLRPVIKSPRECKRILIDLKDLKYKIFLCHEDKRKLKGTIAREYIKWGESQGFHERPTCASRARWWDVGIHCFPSHIWQKSVNDRHIQSQIPFNCFVDQRLYELRYSEKPSSLSVVLNSFVFLLEKELLGRVNLGEGALDTAVYEANNMSVVAPSYLDEKESRAALDQISQRDVLSVHAESKTEDRIALDSIVFDALGLRSGQRQEVYAAVLDLAEGRLSKANSV